MKIIADDCNNIREEFVHSLNEIVAFFSSNKKIKIDSDIIELTINMGGFGKTQKSKKYCVYFCSCLIQV